MGLVRASSCPLGWDRLHVARHSAMLEPDPGRAGRVDGSGPPDRGHGRRAAPSGDGDPAGDKNVQASLALADKHYGAIVEPCPPRRGNRKGAVEAAVRFTSGRWWRTLSATSPEEAQASLDRFLAGAGDARERRTPTGQKTTVGKLADAEPLLDLPALPYPATVTVTRPVDDNATVAFRGNRYSVPPGLSGPPVSCATGWRLRPSRFTLHQGHSSPPTGSVRGPSCALPSTGPP